MIARLKVKPLTVFGTGVGNISGMKLNVTNPQILALIRLIKLSEWYFLKAYRRVSGLRAARVMCLCMALCGLFVDHDVHADTPVITVYNWSDYIAPAVLSDFQKESGIRVKYREFDNNEVLENALLEQNHGLDVVVPSQDFFYRQVKKGLYQPIDRTLLTNWPNLDTRFLELLETIDPGHRYAVPYLWGTTGIAYNSRLAKQHFGDQTVDSWGVVFRPSMISTFSKCGVGFLDAPMEIYPAALNYLGLAPNGSSRSDYVGAVKDMLASVSPHVRYFHSNRYIEDLANGKICLAIAWSGDAVQAMDRAEQRGRIGEVQYVIPKEGAAVWVDMLVIPRQSTRVREAHAFINFLLRPDIIARISNYVAYANPNREAFALLDEDIANNPNIYPPEDVRARLFVVEPVPDALSQIIRENWGRIKRLSGHAGGDE